MSETPQPKRIGRYEIEGVLGKGAMGVVYEGKDTRLHRQVAVKTILKSALDSDSAREYSMRFAREAQAVARLNHPNIVQVFDFAEEGEHAYIVMELVRGRELKTFFDAREKFELKEAVHIMGELCEALHFAHEAGIIHRDIKPANVMIDAKGRVKLTDFGVARIVDPDRTLSDKTQAGMVVGTPSYMSPEQIQGHALDRRTDIFSAGVILYEFLCGQKPFTGSGAWTIAKKILSEDAAPPSSLNPALSPLFDAVVAKALARNLANRYQTARQLGYAIQRAAEGVADADDSERTLRMRAIQGDAPGSGGDATELRTAVLPAAAASKVAELEFWRSIKDGNDPADFELYIEQFPTGIYAALARRKIAKLRGQASGGLEQERREVEEAARREAEAKQKLAEEKAEMEAALARREAEFQQREAALQKREAAAPRKTGVVPAVAVLVAVATAAALWEWLKPPDEAEQRVAELTRKLEESRRREAELESSRQREGELMKELALARQRAAEAQKSGDLARQREFAEQVRLRELEAKKQAEVTRRREDELARAKVQPAAPKKTEPVRPAEAPKPAEPVKMAAVTPAPAPAPAPVPAVPQEATPEALLQHAIALESEGRVKEASRLLARAVREGRGQASGQAAKRLGDLLQKGGPGLPRDYGEALRYYEIARLNGVDVAVTKGR
ncbi:MAG: protein kinase [Burkholderiales bacterium]|nr:protein kinase [Burkholderiales bacterium]